MALSSKQVIAEAENRLMAMRGKLLDVLELRRPPSVEAGVGLASLISKLSPIVANFVEYEVVKQLNLGERFAPHGWVRQDPDFPDALLQGLTPETGIEIKAWFPLATEITGRFRESQARLEHAEIHVCVIAWLPSRLLYGMPQVLDVALFPARSVALARDTHYHDPPRYLVLEPQDTSKRTRNLQQTNTHGLRFQGDAQQLAEAEQLVSAWGPQGRDYSLAPAYVAKVEQLRRAFPYRLDTNFAKIDRIDHAGIEAFKRRVLAHELFGASVDSWRRRLTHKDPAVVAHTLEHHLGIGSEV